jgi:amphi-Trp domain-containing protein
VLQRGEIGVGCRSLLTVETADGFITVTAFYTRMADTTSGSQSLSREEVAGELESLANELRQGGEEVDVNVANKSVSLNPPDTFDYDIEVNEREPMLGDKRESISIDLSWQTEE